MTERGLKKLLLENGCDDVVIYSAPDYADAFMGVSVDGIAYYDYETMVECLIEEGSSEEDAREWIDYNCVGLCGEGMPEVWYADEDEEEREKTLPKFKFVSSAFEDYINEVSGIEPENVVEDTAAIA